MTRLHGGLVVGNKNGRREWPGGYIRKTKAGADVYVIEKEIRGQRFHVSTRCGTITAAMKQLERFQADPASYHPAGEAEYEPVLMTTELVLAFREWQLANGRIRKHANQMAHRLADWQEDLGGIDLRRVSVRDHLKPALDKRQTSRPYRIIAIKRFYKWLRIEKGLLAHHEDPTPDLPVPQANPEKWKRRKAVAAKAVQKVLPKLRGAYRDALLVMSNTGMHVTELERFIRSPEAEIVYGKRGQTIAALRVKHKNREPHPYAITSADALAAAERLRKGGSVPARMNKTLREACRKAKVAEFTYGVMRHSVATWLEEKGGDPQRLLGHKDKRTTDRFYADVALPIVTIAPPRFRA